MTANLAAEADPVRKKILSAMQRLLDGNPLRSTGRLSVSQLAIEADLPRWHLTHQHVDLKELFQAKVRATGSTPAAFAQDLSEFESLKAKHAKLVKHCAALEKQVAFYAAVINTMALEKVAADGTALVSDLETRRRRGAADDARRPHGDNADDIGPC